MGLHTMERIEQPIEKLIKQYPDAGRILHQLGVFFLQHPGKTLRSICQEQNLDPAKVIEKLNRSIKHEEAFDLEQFPTELLIEYLRHTHYVFIKDRLPYITHLINDYPDDEANDMVRELKVIFPEFVKELISHVYEEEDSLFAYISALSQKQKKATQIPNKMADYRVNDFADDHHHDDAMAGIRELTANYQTGEEDGLRFKTLMRTLKSFEDEMNTHAQVENEILFPKALELESAVMS